MRSPTRGKEPASARVLDTWVQQAQSRVGLDAGRLRWLVASPVVVAALQRSLTANGQPRFLLKGGTYLQHRLNWSARPTRDIDGVIRGDLQEFLTSLDGALRAPWGPLILTLRTEVEVIPTPTRLSSPGASE